MPRRETRHSPLNKDRIEALQSLVKAGHVPSEKTRKIYRHVLSVSKFLKSGNFETIHVEDLRTLFSLYDNIFFEGVLASWVRDDGAGQVAFGLSNRMTRAAGHTVLRRIREITPRGIVERRHYEIAISTFLLYENFRADMRTVTSAGLICENRLEALQRTFEHELIHLAEFLAWGRSSCAAPNFHQLSQNIFGHESRNHNLITPREVAATTYQIRVGDLVSFDFDGAMLKGRVNRITKRATILCESHTGRLYSNGNRYLVFYVPLKELRKI